jgi:hypothetical protein
VSFDDVRDIFITILIPKTYFLIPNSASYYCLSLLHTLHYLKMKLAIPAITLALAASTAAQYDKQSKPFYLVLNSENKTVNGQYLAACHEGAAIEALCLANAPSPSKPGQIAASTFTFNTSDTVVTPNATLGSPGWVTYELRGGNFNVSEPLGLYVEPTTNVALPLFYPGTSEATTLSFDEHDLLNIQGYVHDTLNPPTWGDYVAYYRWYSCTTYYTGYTYVTLTWVLGEGAPQNPTCVKVDVKRVFLEGEAVEVYESYLAGVGSG